MTVRKKHEKHEYEGDMARICEKWKYENKNNDIEFSSKSMVSRRDIRLTGHGRSGLEEKGFEDSQIPILEDMG